MTASRAPDSRRRNFIVGAIAVCTSFFARKASAQPVAETPSPKIGRRIVTGIDARGRSRVASEEAVPSTASWNTEGHEGFVFWAVREVPTVTDGPIEPTPGYRPENRAPARGLDGRLFTWQPGVSVGRHATPTLDFIIVLSGQLELILDTETRVLNPGDVLIQRGTQHAWRVIGSEACTFAGVFVDIKHRAPG